MHSFSTIPGYSTSIEDSAGNFQRTADYLSRSQQCRLEGQKIHLRPEGEVYLSPDAGWFELTLEEDGSVFKLILRRNDPLYLLTGFDEDIFVLSSRVIQTEYYRIVSTAKELYVAVNNQPLIRVHGGAARLLHQLSRARFSQRYDTLLIYDGESQIGIRQLPKLQTLQATFDNNWFRLQVADFAVVAKRMAAS